MKVIIAGGRDCWNAELVIKAIAASRFHIDEVVCGKAAGVDTLGERWAQWAGLPVAEFPADWDQYGKAAGPIRNKQMAVYADALIAVWDEKSRGTANMIKTMDSLGKPFYVLRYQG